MKIKYISALGKAVSAALIVAGTAACTTIKAPEIVSVTPANGDRVDNYVATVGFAFSAPVKLETLRVSGPRGAHSKNQILVADGDIVPLSATFSYPLKSPVSVVGRYWIDLMAWDEKSRTSYSHSYSFGVGSAESLHAYDIDMATWDEAQAKAETPQADKE